MRDRPTNLRIVKTQKRGGVPLSFDVRFDGDSTVNTYDLQVRPSQDLPVDDDPFGHPEFVPSANGKWSPKHKGWIKDDEGNRVWGNYQTVGVRRTWTSYGGADQNTGRARTQANQDIRVVVSELPFSKDGPVSYTHLTLPTKA